MTDHNPGPHPGWEPYFLPSNSTHGQIFKAGPQGCDSCLKDHTFHHGIEPEGGYEHCDILSHSLIGDRQKEWESRWDRGALEMRCTAWEGPCPCPESRPDDRAEWRRTADDA